MIVGLDANGPTLQVTALLPVKLTRVILGSLSSKAIIR